MYIKYIKHIPLFLLCVVLLLQGCGGAGEESTPPAPETPAPAEETAPPDAEETRISSLTAIPAGSVAEVTAALESAWDRGSVQPGPAVTVGEGCADVLARDGDILYIIRGKRVLVIRLGGEKPSFLPSLTVGEDWMEQGAAQSWGGSEKQPVALCALRGRLAVISELSEYACVTDENGLFAFRDSSRTVVELFDTEVPEQIVPMASYGLSGVPACVLAKDGRLYVASRRQLFAEDFPAGRASEAMPCVFNGAERRNLPTEKLTVLSDSSDWVTALGVYSPYNGTVLEECAVIGGGEKLLMDPDGLCFFKDSAAAEFSFEGDALSPLTVTEPELSADALLSGAFRGETRREATVLHGIDWSTAWGTEGVLSLKRTETGVRMTITERGRITAETELGYDLQAAPEEYRGIYTDPTTGMVILPAEDGWAAWQKTEEGFIYVRSLFSPDSSENRRVFLLNGTLYAADSRRLFAMDPVTLRSLGEWYL